MKSHMQNKSLFHSFKNAWAGLVTAVRHEKVFSLELACLAAVLAASLIFRIDRNEAQAVIICCVLVLTTECLNSAIERIVDLVCPDYHPLAKQIKDLSAGAVLITVIGSLVLGIAIFAPKIVALL